MKKNNRSRHKEFRCIRLYLSKLEEIWELLESNCKSMTVETDRYIIENFDDFKKIKDPIKKLNIFCHEPYIYIHISQSYCTLEIQKDEEKTFGIFEKVKEILYNSQSNLRFLSSNITYFIIYFIFVFWQIFLIHIFKLIDYYYYYYYYYLLISIPLVLVFTILWHYINLKKQGLVIPYEKKLFWFIRNKDKLILLIIGSVLTLLVEWILRQYIR